MHPMLALQTFIGPIFFHLITRPSSSAWSASKSMVNKP
jgi:hypothetical protein